MLKASISGIRGIWGESLVIQNVCEYTQSFAQYLGKSKKIILATDTRKTGIPFKHMLIGVLLNYGYTIIDLDIAATPLVSFAVRHLKADAGIVLTASHNPVIWNAFKFIDEQGLFFNQESMNSIINNYQTKNFPEYNHENIGCVEAYTNIVQDYLQHIKSYFNIKMIQDHHFNIAVDMVNGTASLFMPLLEHMLDINIIPIFNNIRLDFERQPEPKQENLDLLKKTVIKHNTDFGIAFDPDGDRLALVNHEGEALGEHWTLLIAYLCYLELKNPQTKDIAINLSTSILFEHIASQFKASVIRTAVGEINVTQKLLSKQISLGGEGNGGVIFTPLNPCRDSIIALFFILEYLAITKKTLKEMTQSFPNPYITNTSVEYENSFHLEELEKRITSQMHTLGYENLDVNKIDGLWIGYPEGFVHIRLSNTENIIRIIAEGFHQSNHELLVKECLSYLNS